MAPQAKKTILYRFSNALEAIEANLTIAKNTAVRPDTVRAVERAVEEIQLARMMLTELDIRLREIFESDMMGI